MRFTLGCWKFPVLLYFDFCHDIARCDNKKYIQHYLEFFVCESRLMCWLFLSKVQLQITVCSCRITFLLSFVGSMLAHNTVILHQLFLIKQVHHVRVSLHHLFEFCKHNMSLLLLQYRKFTPCNMFIGISSKKYFLPCCTTNFTC